jgi:hypothetical protein
MRFVTVIICGIFSYHWTLNVSCSWTLSQLYLCEYPIILRLGSVVGSLVVHVFRKGARLSADSLSLTCLRRGPFRHYGGRKSMHFTWKRDSAILNIKIFLAIALYNFVCSDYSPPWWFRMQVLCQSVHKDENCLFCASAFALEHTEKIHLQNTVYVKCDMTLKFNWQQTLYRKSWRIQRFRFLS